MNKSVFADFYYNQKPLTLKELSCILIFMPITKSAKKALRQNVKRHKVNLKRMSDVKSAIKQYKKLVVGNKKDEAQKQLSSVYKNLDKAVKVKLIKKNTANRLKSRLSKLLK